MEYVRGVILNGQPSSQLLHLQTVQRSLRIQILRALPADMMCRVGRSASHVRVRDGANFCVGKTEREVKCRGIMVEMYRKYVEEIAHKKVILMCICCTVCVLLFLL